MKQHFILSIILYAFLGYLWILFMQHIYKTAYSMHNVFFGGLTIIIGTLLFWEIEKRITPFNEYEKNHPVKIIGVVSFLTVVFVNFFVVKFI
jgi:hypothetical protein